jgi:hypothetical protein
LIRKDKGSTNNPTDMVQDEIVIRKSKGHYRTDILTAVIGVLLTIMGSLKAAGGAGKVFYTIAAVTVFLGMLFYAIYQLNKRRVEMSISIKGVYLRRKGLYPWDLIDSFSTLESLESFKIELVLHFREYADEDFDITNMEIKADEIITLMNVYKLAAAPYNASDHYR